ncbi:unnamed protein product, partial [Laminaria digitata]
GREAAWWLACCWLFKGALHGKARDEHTCEPGGYDHSSSRIRNNTDSFDGCGQEASYGLQAVHHSLCAVCVLPGVVLVVSVVHWCQTPWSYTRAERCKRTAVHPIASLFFPFLYEFLSLLRVISDVDDNWLSSCVCVFRVWQWLRLYYLV